MWILWRIIPLCAIAFALWRIVPALKVGASGFGQAQTVTNINALTIANSLQGELGAAMSGAGDKSQDTYTLNKKKLPEIIKNQHSKLALKDGWNRPYQVREANGGIEVVSCGEDGECGNFDDIIEVVRADGKKVQIKSGEQDRGMKPLKPRG